MEKALLSKINSTSIKKAKSVPIEEYLEAKGFTLSKAGSRYICRSPFSEDKNPSFIVYSKKNDFFDYSSGFGGDIIKLVEKMEDVSFTEAVTILLSSNFSHKIFKKEFELKINKKFDINKYITTNANLIRIIDEYAKKRMFIYNGYIHTAFFDKKMRKFIPSVGFPLCNMNMDISGIKCRAALNGYEPRFKNFGKSGFYVLENIIDLSDPVLFLIESETSAISLYRYLINRNINSVVISFGAVTSIPKNIPKKYRWIKNKKIIIDYDGNEELYQERLSRFSKLNCESIKFELEKGEDINTLLLNGDVNLIDKLLWH